VVYNGIALDRYPFREDKEDFLFFLDRADEEKAPHLAIQAARRAGRRLVLCVTTKNDREQAYWAEQLEPLLGDHVEVRGSATRSKRRSCWPWRRRGCSRSSGWSRSGW
jgi:glycosyltransferase involved in cell wall biosynthesis